MGGQYSFNLGGWTDCGKIYFPKDSPPDVHGMNTGYWNVNMMPHQGKTFLGLVTRFDDSFESVSQTLSTPLKAGHCYTLRAYICQAETYQSRTRRSSDTTENFIIPTTLRIWGGNKVCDRREKLYESEPIQEFQWTSFTFQLKPLQDLSAISIEAYYPRTNHMFTEAFNGHLMIDDLSLIMECPCESVRK